MGIISLATEKGGSAKTTMALHLAWWKARGEKVLLVDLDSQASATRVLLKNKLPESGHVGHVLLRHLEPEKAIVRGAGVDLLPSHPELAGALTLLQGELGPERRLGLLLAPLTEQYDFIIVDCPPGRSVLLIGALLASQEVLVPVVPDFFGLHGLAGLLELLRLVRRDLGGSCLFGGAIACRTTRTKLSNEAVARLRTDLGPRFLGAIPDSVKVAEALAASLPVWSHAPGSPVAAAMSACCQAIAEQGRAHHAA